MRWLRVLAASVASMSIGCGSGDASPSDKLEGTWVEEADAQGDALPYTFVLEKNGNASGKQIEIDPGEDCSGALRFTDLKWSATATVLKLSGSHCSGEIFCTNHQTSAGERLCPKKGKELTWVLTYSLSTDEDTLDVSEFTEDGLHALAGDVHAYAVSAVVGRA